MEGAGRRIHIALMSKVADNIQEQKLTLQNQGIDTYYEENQGNHFADVTERMVKVMSAQN